MTCSIDLAPPSASASLKSYHLLHPKATRAALGHNSIMDPWFPLGKGDMLTAPQLALFLCHMSGHEEINDVLDLITINAAKALRIQDRYGIAEGKPADFLLLDAPTAFEALRLVPARLQARTRSSIYDTGEECREKRKRR